MKTFLNDWQTFLKIAKRLAKDDNWKVTSQLIKVEPEAVIYTDHQVLFKIYGLNPPVAPGVYSLSDLKPSEINYVDYQKIIPNSFDGLVQLCRFDEFEYFVLCSLGIPIHFQYWDLFRKHLADYVWYLHYNGRNQLMILSKSSVYNREEIINQNFILMMPVQIKDYQLEKIKWIVKEPTPKA